MRLAEPGRGERSFAEGLDPLLRLIEWHAVTGPLPPERSVETGEQHSQRRLPKRPGQFRTWRERREAYRSYRRGVDSE
jgi:hypothetical protein